MSLAKPVSRPHEEVRSDQCALIHRLTFSERSRDRRTRLRDKVPLPRDWLRPDATVMFVAPDDEIYAIIKKPLWNGFLWPMFNSKDVRVRRPERCSFRTDFGVRVTC